MKIKNCFSHFLLLIILTLSIFKQTALFGMEQYQQEEPELTNESSTEQSMVALNVLINTLNQRNAFIESSANQNSARLEDKLLAVFEQDSYIKHLDATTLQKLSHITAKILKKADELHQQNFISFYHTRPTIWDFFSHIVKVCEEKKNRCLFSDETNFFMYKHEMSNKVLLNLEKEYHENNELFRGQGNSYYGDAQHLTFPVRWLLTRLGESHFASRNSAISASLFITSSQPNESALYIFSNNFGHQNKFDVLGCEQVQKDFQALLEKYGISDKSDVLSNLYQKTFGTSYNTLYHIAIRKELLDRCVLLTAEYAFSLEYCKGKLTSDLFARMNTEQSHQELSREFEHQAHEPRDLMSVQARIFIDTQAFTNPGQVKTYAYYQENFGTADQKTSFDQESQNRYWQELRRICNES